MQPILVTGGAGFIGSRLVKQLVGDDKVPVINVDKLTYAGNLDSLAELQGNPLHTFVQGDIGDFSQMSALLEKHRPRAIMNLAAESHVDRSIDSPAEFLKTNVMGTFQLLEATRAHWSKLPEPERSQFRFLHISTDEVYGSLGAEGKFEETTPYAPNSPYSASKAASDHFVRAYLHTYGLPVLTTNCSNNYGPCQFPEKLIPLIVLNAVEGKPLPVYGDGGNIRDWLYVDDHCHALRTVLAKGTPGEVYNVGGNSERTNLEIVHTICALVDEMRPNLPHRPAKSLIKFVKDRPGHDRRYAIDSSKIQRELSWRPQQNLETGLRATVEWYLANSTWVQRVTSGVYRRERLGLSGDHR